MCPTYIAFANGSSQHAHAPFSQPYMDFAIRAVPQDTRRGTRRHLVRDLYQRTLPYVPHSHVVEIDSKETPSTFVFFFLASTCSFRPTRNTSSPLPTTARYGCGTSRPRAASRRTSATKTPSTASPPASASRAASGSCLAAKTAKYTCGTCRAGRSCRSSRAIKVNILCVFCSSLFR